MPQKDPANQTHMLREIFSQPACWQECLEQLETDPVIADILTHSSLDSEWLFIGCGTSYYLAQAAAASFTMITGAEARAIPASEILLFPELAFRKSQKIAPVVISRSGRTTETVKTAKAIQADIVAFTCAPDQPLAQNSRYPVVLSAANEQSTVMTRSFSSILLGLQHLAARLVNQRAVLDALQSVPGVVEPLLREIPSRLQDFVATHDFEDYVFLGQGPFYGVANEAALKVMESSSSYAQSFHSLEFRHGPKSIAGPKTLIGFFLSDAGFEMELDLLEEVKALASATIVVTPRSNRRLQAAADVLIEIPIAGPECARLAACTPWGQLLGLYTGLKKGINPDSPRNLTQVVILDDFS